VTRDEIRAQVIDIVAEQMGVDDKASINDETSFVNDLNADSLDTVELVMEFEDRFKTKISDEKAEEIKTVGDAVDFIADSQNAASA
jgi:acyl carrier protein